MKRWRFATAALMTALLTLSASAGDYDTVMGYSYDGIQISKSADARLAFEVWVKEIASKENLNMGVTYCNTPEAAFAAFRAHDFDLLSFNPLFYLKHHEELDPVISGFWSLQVSDTPYESYLLVVRNDSGIATPGDLKGKKVATRENGYMARLFLDRLLLEQMHHGYDGYIEMMEATEHYSSAALKTYFGNVDAALIPEYAFDVVKEMNPALGEKLTVIARSPRIFPFVIIAAHKQMPKALLDIYVRNAYGLDKSERGRMILQLYKLKRVVGIPLEDMSVLKRYYDEYRALVAEYGNE